METMEEIHATTRDEYGLKAGGYLQPLEKFDTLFGFKPAHTLFCAAEQVSFALYKRSSMTERRLKHCLLLHVHKELTDSLDLVLVSPS